MYFIGFLRALSREREGCAHRGWAFSFFPANKLQLPHSIVDRGVVNHALRGRLGVSLPSRE
jgi:hypothetical protein